MTKLIVLVAIVAAVFFAFKYINRIKAQRAAGANREDARQENVRRARPAPRVRKAEDLVECPRCGTFVHSLDEHACARKS